MIKKWIKEIKKVGFKDWFWFVFILRRNEFHHSLNLNFNSYKKNDKKEMKRIVRERQRAHDIDMMLSDVKNENTSNT